MHHEVAPEDAVTVDGVRVAKKAPTVLAAAAALPLVEGAGLLDGALNDGAVGLDELRTAHWRSAGRDGAARTSELLLLAGDGPARRPNGWLTTVYGCRGA